MCPCILQALSGSIEASSLHTHLLNITFDSLQDLTPCNRKRDVIFKTNKNSVFVTFLKIDELEPILYRIVSEFIIQSDLIKLETQIVVWFGSNL